MHFNKWKSTEGWWICTCATRYCCWNRRKS